MKFHNPLYANVYLVSLYVFEHRKSRLMSAPSIGMRVPRLGNLIGNVDFNSLKPRIKIIDSNHIEKSKNEIQQKIEELNTRLFDGDSNALLTDAHIADPPGFICERQIFNITEISHVVQVNCWDTTEEVCEMVRYSNNSKAIQSRKKGYAPSDFLIRVLVCTAQTT